MVLIYQEPGISSFCTEVEIRILIKKYRYNWFRFGFDGSVLSRVVVVSSFIFLCRCGADVAVDKSGIRAIHADAADAGFHPRRASAAAGVVADRARCTGRLDSPGPHGRRRAGGGIRHLAGPAQRCAAAARTAVRGDRGSSRQRLARLSQPASDRGVLCRFIERTTRARCVWRMARPPVSTPQPAARAGLRVRSLARSAGVGRRHPGRDPCRARAAEPPPQQLARCLVHLGLRRPGPDLALSGGSHALDVGAHAGTPASGMAWCNAVGEGER